MLEIRGSCHCGNIGFDLLWPDAGRHIAGRRCGCTFCRKHGGIWTSNPAARLAVKVEDAALLSKYRFGTATADFYVCARCGAVPLVGSEIDGHLYAVVNVNSFDDPEALSLSEAPTDFEGEDLGGRLERRKRNWISAVDIDL